MNSDDIRVLVVDDSVMYRRIVSDVLAEVPGVKVVGIAANGKIALTKIEQLRPNILTLDLEMPEMNGLELLRRLKQTGSDVGVIVLSGVSKQSTNATMAALELGAFDFVAKPAVGNVEENAKVLQQKLGSRIKALAHKRNTHKILHGRDKKKRAENDVARRMRAIVNAGSDHVEVVALGVSTGGPEALNHMLPQLPEDLSAALLIVQHMPPLFTKSLADDLNKCCALAVSEAVDGQAITPGHVLIAPGGKQMKVVKEERRATICITDDPPENSCRPSVDYLFRSVTRVYGSNAVGVIMTGMGNDGAQGCRQMKQRGAAVIAQDEASCVVFGMPREPIEDGMVDVVAPLDEIATEIVRLVGRGAVVCK